MSVLGPCEICGQPMLPAHVVAGVWIGCRPSPFRYGRPSLDLLALDLTIAALDRGQRHPEAEPVREVVAQLRPAAEHASVRLGSHQVEQSVTRAHHQG